MASPTNAYTQEMRDYDDETENKYTDPITLVFVTPDGARKVPDHEQLFELETVRQAAQAHEQLTAAYNRGNQQAFTRTGRFTTRHWNPNHHFPHFVLGGSRLCPVAHLATAMNQTLTDEEKRELTERVNLFESRQQVREEQDLARARQSADGSAEAANAANTFQMQNRNNLNAEDGSDDDSDDDSVQLFAAVEPPVAAARAPPVAAARAPPVAAAAPAVDDSDAEATNNANNRRARSPSLDTQRPASRARVEPPSQEDGAVNLADDDDNPGDDNQANPQQNTLPRGNWNQGGGLQIMCRILRYVRERDWLSLSNKTHFFNEHTPTFFNRQQQGILSDYRPVTARVLRRRFCQAYNALKNQLAQGAHSNADGEHGEGLPEHLRLIRECEEALSNNPATGAAQNQAQQNRAVEQSLIGQQPALGPPGSVRILSQVASENNRSRERDPFAGLAEPPVNNATVTPRRPAPRRVGSPAPSQPRPRSVTRLGRASEFSAGAAVLQGLNDVISMNAMSLTLRSHPSILEINRELAQIGEPSNAMEQEARDRLLRIARHVELAMEYQERTWASLGNQQNDDDQPNGNNNNNNN